MDSLGAIGRGDAMKSLIRKRICAILACVGLVGCASLAWAETPERGQFGVGGFVGSGLRQQQDDLFKFPAFLFLGGLSLAGRLCPVPHFCVRAGGSATLGEHGVAGMFGILPEFTSKWIGVGLGFGSSLGPQTDDHWGLPSPLIARLRVGPDWLHGIVRYGVGENVWWLSGEWAAIGVASESAGSRPWSAGLSVVPVGVSVLDNRDVVRATPLFADGIAFSTYGTWIEKTNGFGAYLYLLFPRWADYHLGGFIVGFSWQFHNDARDQRSPDVAQPRQSQPPQPVWHLPKLPLGRQFTQRLGPLRVRADVPPPPVLTSVCTVDESLEADNAKWTHLTCTQDLPETAPTSWHTGCYMTDASGIWRLPRCPGEPDAPAGRLQLLVANARANPGGQFVDLGVLTDQTFRVGQQTVHGACEEIQADATYRTCLAPEGILWSSRRWRHGVTTEPEQAVTLVDSQDVKLEPQPRHFLRFNRPDSAHCEAGPMCTVFGLCAYKEQRCVAARDQDCATADVCTRFGHCHARAGSCIAATDGDCKASTDCSENGLCTARSGTCRASGTDCQTATVCENEARCSVRDQRCALTSSDDCMRSSGCASEGLCVLKSGECVAGEGSCAGTSACTREGRCVAEEGRCVAPKP